MTSSDWVTIITTAVPAAAAGVALGLWQRQRQWNATFLMLIFQDFYPDLIEVARAAAGNDPGLMDRLYDRMSRRMGKLEKGGTN